MQKRENAGVIIWRFIYPLLVYLGVEFLIELVMMIGYIFYALGKGIVDLTDLEALSEASVNFIYSYSLYINIIAAVILVPIFSLFMKRDVKRDKYYGRYTEYSPYEKKWLWLLPVTGFAAAMGFNHVVPIVFAGLGELISAIGSLFGVEWNVDFYSGFDQVSQILYSGSVIVQIIASSVAAPLIEEFLFRGLIYKRIRTYLKTLPSMLISAAVFGIMHGNAIQFLYAFILGMFFAFVYEKFKTIWAPVIFHAGANFIAVLVETFMPDGGVGLALGTYALLIVVELSVTFLLLRFIDIKVDRVPVENESIGED